MAARSERSRSLVAGFRRRARLGPLKLLAAAVLVASTAIVALLAQEPAIPVAYALLAAGIASVAYLVVGLRRQVRSMSGRSGRSSNQARAEQAVANGLTVVGGMASIPARVGALEQAVGSIADQLDHLHVYLNGYDAVPDFLVRDGITVWRSQDHSDLCDTGKFFGLREHDTGVYFTLDDDLVYPPDYVRRMVGALDRIGFAGVVGVHGVVYATNPLSFLNRKIAHYLKGNRELRPVSLLGTGTVAFPIDLLPDLTLDRFPRPRMADVWFATHLKERRIPLFAIERAPGWLEDADVTDPAPSIWETTRADHAAPTAVIIDQRPWGVDELIQRVDAIGVAEKLPRWQAFASYLRTLRDHGAEVALARCADPDELATYVIFYAEPPDVLATARAALGLYGRQSHLFDRTIAVAQGHDPHEAAQLLERALWDAIADEDRGDAARFAVAASRALRRGGDLERAQTVLDAIRDDHGSALLAEERLNLAIDRNEWPAARALLFANAHRLPRKRAYDLRFALVAAHTESVEAAAPWVANLLLDPEASAEHARLVSHLRRFHGLGHRLAGRFPMLPVEEAARSGAIDPHTLINLHLALGDREAAAELVAGLDASLRSQGGLYPLVLAATAPEFEGTVAHLNRRLEADGFAGLRVFDAAHRPLPLARVVGDPPEAVRHPPVTVIMTAYNCASTLDYALRSVLNQSVRDIQVLVVDDSSTDETPQLIAQFARRDDRIKPLRMSENRGPYACRNLALDHAEGHLIAVHDADDFAHPQRLEHQIRVLSETEGVACFTAHLRVADDGSLVPENHGQLVGEGPMTLMVNRQVVEDLGYYLPVRSRGDVEYRDRMIHYYGAHRVVHDPAVLLLARDAATTNSRRFDVAREHVGSVARIKAEARRRHQRAAGRREQLRVAGPG